MSEVLPEIGKHLELQLVLGDSATRRASPARATGNRRAASALEAGQRGPTSNRTRTPRDGRPRAGPAEETNRFIPLLR